jgi:protein TonB
MFEGSLLAASGPRLQPAKLRLATGAVAAHAALLAGVAIVQVWRIDPVPPPPPSGVFQYIVLPELDSPAPRRGNPTPPEAQRQVAPAEPRQPLAPVQPDRIEELAATTSAAAGAEAVPDTGLEACEGCTPDGSPDGVPFGTGLADGPPVDGDGVIDFVAGGAVQAPVIVHRVQPLYPRPAIVVRKEGAAVVQATIDASGRVVDARILVDPGFGLGASARDAVLQFRFRPATLNGRPIAVRYQLTVNFALR